MRCVGEPLHGYQNSSHLQSCCRRRHLICHGPNVARILEGELAGKYAMRLPEMRWACPLKPLYFSFGGLSYFFCLVFVSSPSARPLAACPFASSRDIPFAAESRLTFFSRSRLWHRHILTSSETCLRLILGVARAEIHAAFHEEPLTKDFCGYIFFKRQASRHIFIVSSVGAIAETFM